MDKRYSILNDADLRRRLTRVALAILDSPMLAEEIVQEAYLRLLVASSGTVENPSSWLFTVTRNLALDQARRRLRERELIRLMPDEHLFELNDGLHATNSRIAEIVSRLIEVSDAQVTAILLLHIVFGMSYEEIATICGRSSAACRQAGSRALRKCLNSMQADLPFDETVNTELYVHAILHVAIAPLIDSLSVTTPVSMQSHALVHSGRSCNLQPSRSCRTRQVLVLTATGVKWALILDGVTLCQFDHAQLPHPQLV